MPYCDIASRDFDRFGSIYKHLTQLTDLSDDVRSQSLGKQTGVSFVYIQRQLEYDYKPVFMKLCGQLVHSNTIFKYKYKQNQSRSC